jgi:hypothetical protein
MTDLADHLPAVRTFDWSNCRHAVLEHRGTNNRSGKDQVGCAVCRCRFVVGDRRRTTPESIVRVLGAAVIAGLSAATAGELAGIPESTSRLYCRLIRTVLARVRNR